MRFVSYNERKKVAAALKPIYQAPDAEAAARVHKEAHGLVADEIFEVTEHE